MEQTSPKITPISKMREKCLNVLTEEALTIYQKVIPIVKDPAAAQDLTTSILIGMEHVVPYHSYNFENNATDPVKVPEPAAPDISDRGPVNSMTPEQKKEMERLATIHGTDPVAKELEKAAAYDPNKKVWVTCPTCGSTAINHTTGPRPWQGCDTDRLFLNADGTIKPYTRGGGQQRVG